MKRETRRHIVSWMLLAVFVPMLLLSSIHVHEESAVVSTTGCADCVHHNCHGHMTSMDQWTHDCVLCQFLTLTFVATAAICLIAINKLVCSSIDAHQCHVGIAHSGIVGLRAPPAFSI